MEPSPTLSEFDKLAIQQSFTAACGVTALHLVLESMEEDDRKAIKETILRQWRGAWTEAFRGQMNQYTALLGKFSNSSKLAAPEDMQVAFNQALNEAEKMGRISLGMEGAK